MTSTTDLHDDVDIWRGFAYPTEAEAEAGANPIWTNFSAVRYVRADVGDAS